MIQKLLDEPYWNELPKIFNQLFAEKDHFFAAHYYSQEKLSKKQMNLYSFMSNLAQFPDPKSFWKESDKESTMGRLITVKSIRGTYKSFDLNKLKTWLLDEIWFYYSTETFWDGLSQEEVLEMTKGYDFLSLTKQNNLNIIYQSLLQLREEG